SLNLLMADHEELIRFVKKLNLELYKITNDEAHLNRLVSIQESALYSRIRSRLDRNDSLQFVSIPPEVRSTEMEIKTAMISAFDGEQANEQKLAGYVKSVERWNGFQEMIRREYPDYYTMRYANIFIPIDSMQHSLPEKTTVVRYFFIEDKLYALVADRNKKKL